MYHVPCAVVAVAWLRRYGTISVKMVDQMFDQVSVSDA
jgi:hypothetical protein